MEEFSLDHVQLAIPPGGEDIARAFYVDLIGFTEIPKPQELAKRGGLWLRCGVVSIHLSVDSAFAPATKAHPALRSTGYVALLERLAASGMTIVSDPLPFDGRAHCYVTVPFGNRIELIDA